MANPEDTSEPIKSPCVGICRVDGAGRCEGCLRTLQEIAVWSTCGKSGQREILRQIELRKSRGDKH